MPDLVLSAREISLMRIIAQGLVPATAAPDPASAVARLLAVQGQQVSAVPHALLSRLPCGMRGADVDAAFERGELVKSWPMRGTVHVTAAADHHWLRQALRHRTGRWIGAVDAALAGLGGLDAVAATTLETIAQAQREGGAGASRARLSKAWTEAGYVPALEAVDHSDWGVKRRLLLALHLTGVIVQGPRRGNEHLLVAADGLPGAQTGPGGAGGCAQGEPGHEVALVEIARRYAAAHGPVSAADLARWTTLPVTQCRRLLEQAVEAPSTPVAGAVPLVGAETLAAGSGAPGEEASGGGTTSGLGRAGGAGPGTGTRTAGSGGFGTLASGGVGLIRARAADGAGPAGSLYLRADLPELLAEQARAAARTLFLASFDELHVGYKDRTCLTDDVGERLICPAANGMFRPLLVDRGRLVAVRPVSEGLIWDDRVRRSARVERDVEAAVRQMRRRLAG